MNKRINSSQLVLDNLTEKFRKQLQGILHCEKIDLFYENRQLGFDTFQRLGIPHRKTEDYKHIAIASILNYTFQEKNITFSPPPPIINPKTLKNNWLNEYKPVRNHMLLVNGQLISSHIESPDGKSITILPFAEAYEQYASYFDQYFNGQIKSSRDTFAGLNTALYQGGVFVHINQTIKHPIVIHQLYDANEEAMLLNPRIFILVEENTKASIINNTQCTSRQPIFVNIAVEMVTKKNSEVHYYNPQINLENLILINHTGLLAEQNSKILSYQITWGASFVRNNLTATLSKKESEVFLYGFYAANEKEKIDNHTIVDHQAPHTYSKEWYKGMVGKNGKGIFNGKIYVQQIAQKTNAFQTNNNLMLSDQSNIHTQPQLEIWADDVKCSHGATIGQLEEELLFYMKSRGMDEKRAKKILLKAFANELFELMVDDSLMDIVQKSFEQYISTKKFQ